MMKRITHATARLAAAAALLAVLLGLCLGTMIRSALADEAVLTVSGKAGESKVTVTAGAGKLEPGTYRLCSLGIDGKTAALFDVEVEDGKDFELEIDTAALAEGQKLAVRIGDYTGAGTAAKNDNKYTPSSGGSGSGGGSISHSVNVSPSRNGSVTVKPTSAAKGEKVTITVKPSEGYVLDTLTVKDANGKEVTLTKVDDTTYTFVMPETSVTVTATFKAAGAKTVSFSDVTDPNYTFYADIMWAAEKGYMNGYSDGTFRPNANTTRQALWMVLARIDGANPSDMSAARAWAMANGVSDGTNPANPMSRQQMVTMLYRYAQLKGYTTTGGVSYTTYPDAANVANYAKDAVSWAIGNNILRGTSDGMLNPTGTASRAHFAAFLHRFAGVAGL